MSNINVHTKHQGDCIIAKFGPVGLGWGLRFCISNKLPDSANEAGPHC